MSIEPGNTVDLGSCSTFAQQGGRMSSILPPVVGGSPNRQVAGRWPSSAAAVASEPVTQSAYGLQRPYAERAVDLPSEVADIDLDHVGAVLLPRCPRPHPTADCDRVPARDFA